MEDRVGESGEGRGGEKRQGGKAPETQGGGEGRTARHGQDSIEGKKKPCIEGCIRVFFHVFFLGLFMNVPPVF